MFRVRGSHKIVLVEALNKEEDPRLDIIIETPEPLNDISSM